MDALAKEALLYDFYGELLSENQKEIFSLSVMDDMSLSEIAAEQGVSRQAVSAMIGRCRRILLSYEERLGLLKRFQDMSRAASEIKELAERLEGPEAERIKMLSDSILSRL